ncbi:MAG: phosphatase [Puniceicoccaceae bacterium]|nr:MAG: phosphatase [Puniceicoccaceae bacterium]
MKTVSGDLIQMAREGAFDVIAHGCNCHCTMGAGIARAIREVFPEAWGADRATTSGDRSKLGACSTAEIDRDGMKLTVVNAYTQYDYAGEGVLVDYDAVRSCLRWIRRHAAGRRIGLPKIGAGLAGGDWDRIAAIIREELAGEDVTVVEFRPGG